MTTETAVVKAEPQFAPMVVEPPKATLPTNDEMKVMVTIANSVYKTAGKLIPENIKSSEEAFAIMLAGHELGISPMASFREIYVVKGRTMPSARVLMGLVLHGDPGAQFKWFERSIERAHVRLTRSNGQAIEVEYTMDDAKRAGVSFKNRDGSPSVWGAFPADMLAYKAVTRACRLGGPDLITGIGAGSVRGATAALAAIEEDTDEMPTLETSVRVVEHPTVKQRDRMMALMKEAHETWDSESYDKWIAEKREQFPALQSSETIGKMTNDELKEVADAMEADVRPQPEMAL